jgi:hypothetical protein
MTFLPLSAPATQSDPYCMELFVLLFFVLLALASALGWTADSRDSADWAPTVDGRRQPRRS